MAVYQFSNGASTTLNGSIDNAQTTLVVSSTLGFPTVAQFAIIIDSEIMLVTNVAGTTYTVTRASEATAGVQSPSAHSSGATVRHILTSGSLTGYVLSPVSGALWAPTTLLTLNSIANNYGLVINGPAGAGTSFGVNVMAGTNSSDYAARFQTDALVDILRLRGDGAILFGADSALSTFSGAGVLTMRSAIEVPPSAGAALPAHSYGTLPVKLDEQSTASGASLTLTIPSGGPFRSLLVHFTGRSDQAGAQNLQVQFNADTGNNYDYQLMQDLNATLSGVAPGIAGAVIVAAIVVPSGAVAGAETNAEMTIMNADSTSLRKQIHAYSGGFEADAAANARLTIAHGQWRNTANAITSIKLFPAAGNLISARAVVYGVA